MVMEVKKKSERSPKKDLDFTIASLVNQGFNPSIICSKLGLSKQKVDYHIQRLKRAQIVRKIGYGVWEAREPQYTDYIRRSPKSSLGATAQDKDLFNSNLHSLCIEIPILKGELDLVKDFEGYAQRSFNNWLPQYKRFMSPIGFSIRNNNNKSISIFLFSREMPRSFDITPLVTGTILYVYELLKAKGVVVNVFQAETKNLHISVKNDDLDKVFNKAEKFEVLLGRGCAKILSADKVKPAKAWVDSSPYLGVETNDVEYKNNLVMMPERMAGLVVGFDGLANNLSPVIKELAVNMKLHLKVMRGIERGISNFNKTVRKLDGRLSQKSLRGFM